MSNVTQTCLLITLLALLTPGVQGTTTDQEKTWLDELTGYLNWGGEEGGGGGEEPVNKKVKKPHILYVVMDDQGYGDVGYTYPEQADMRTPLLDKLASEGLIMNRHYSAWMCTPTRASIMTGRYPITLGIQHDVFQPNTEECLNEKELLLPEVIRHNGYATHLVGKWHLGYARWSCFPCMRGFDTAYGYINGETGYIDHMISGYYDFYQCSYNEKNGLKWKILKEDKGVYSLYLYNKRVRHIVKQHDPNTPLFLYLPMQSVHASYYAPEKYYDCTDTKRCTMQAMLSAAEELLTDVIQYFKDAGMWDNTLLVYHSDNGAPKSSYTSNGPLRGTKSHLWEGGVRTVGFLYSENKELLPHRGYTDCYVHVADWYNTLVAISGGWTAYAKKTGLEMPAKLDSIDQSRHLLFNDTNTCPRTQIMLHIDPVKRVAGYMKNQHKLLIGPQDSSASCDDATFYPLNISSIDFSIIELYNIWADPNEAENIADENPDIVADLRRDVTDYLSHQSPLQCQLPTLDDSYPSDEVPYYLPWDFTRDNLPASAYEYNTVT